ncbi:MFS transporter [Azoarcus olearius]|uniref:Transmembrane efflux protein n=1 Tax=Azoarcus sp. (strain BH72) TaxID=418699 RepID=A1K2Z3_AZOSB|nr:MFS transporter [Azoarcus olearius]CAL93198.1 putative transmembrane efflux precursor protein [Azoarcus olearius]
MPLPLLALAIASFGIGTTEFVIMGLLPEVARDLGVDIPRAGMLVSGYAMGVVIGAPILAVVISRMQRRRALLGLIGMFIAGNLLCALAPDYAALMAARIATAFCHGAFFGLGAVVAAGLVAPERRAQAIALMFTGLTLANVLGVPLGTLLGQHAGWRATFWAVVAIGVAAALTLHRWLPHDLGAGSSRGLLNEVRALRRTQVLLAMLISVLSSASLFSVFTYIAPMLLEVTGISPRGVTLVLLLFGAGLTLGNLLGGRLADWRLMPAVIGIFVAVIAVLALLPAALPVPLGAVTVVFLWGVAAFALISPLQMRVVNEAAGAPNLASTVNQGAFNLGNAIGAWVGGVAIRQGVGYDGIPWVGVALAILALAFSIGAHRLEARSLAAARPATEGGR